MLPELGQIALIMALLASTWQCAGIYLAPGHSSHALNQSITAATFAQCICILLAFGLLITCFVQSDFSVLLVAEHSNTAMPMIYKITAAWGNHEGSMLLWVAVLAIFSAIFAFKASLPNIHVSTLRILGFMQAGLLLFILLTSNPFTRLFPYPFEGDDLNPLLQDIGLAIHPPMLYLGYVGFGVVFAIAIAALIHGKGDKELAKLMRPWILLPWGFLTIGIGLGSWWAYRELGWGGFWFWDPVENASLLPWLSGTALLHSNLVLEKRGKFARWVILLAILTFTFSLLGTFLVRSGIITSVHSFASDPTRGVFILLYIALVAGGGLLLFYKHAHRLAVPEPLELMGREGAIAINNLFLLVAAISILAATVYPMLIPLWNGQPISIGAPYYNQTILPLMLPMFLLAGLSGFLAWVETPLKRVLMQVRYDFVVVAATTWIIALYLDRHIAWGIAGLLAGIWLLSTTVHYGIKLHRGGNLTSSRYGMLLSHFGIGLLVLSVTLNSTFKTEQEVLMAKGEKKTVAGYDLEFIDFNIAKEHTYISAKGIFRVWKDEEQVATLTPEERIYMVRSNTTHESAITISPWRDLYLTIRLPSGKNAEENPENLVVTLYHNPMMLALWAALLLIGTGGLIASRKS